MGTGFHGDYSDTQPYLCNQSSSCGDKAYKPVPVNRERKKLTEKIAQSNTKSNETALLSRSVTECEQTAMLNNENKTSDNDGSIGSESDFEIEAEITFVHTDELIV